MNRFKELNNNVMKVSQLLLQDQELCKLLYYVSSTPLDEPDISDTSILLFDNILPQPKSIDTINTTKNILSFIFSHARLNKGNLFFKDCKLVFYIISHLDLWKIDDGIRPYLIAERIDTIFNQLRGSDLSIGQVLFNSFEYREFSNYFCGYILVYDLTDFN